MPVNPTLSRIPWPRHFDTPGTVERIRCACGARYRAFLTPGIPRDKRERLHWAKRQMTQHDGDKAWWWSRRSLLFVLHCLKASAFIEVHRHCDRGGQRMGAGSA